VDCQGLRGVSRSSTGISHKEVIIHHDAGANSHLEIVRTSLEQIISAAKSQDTVLFYFSGHGVLEPESQAFLCLSDTQKGWPSDTALKGTRFVTDVRQLCRPPADDLAGCLS